MTNRFASEFNSATAATSRRPAGPNRLWFPVYLTSAATRRFRQYVTEYVYRVHELARVNARAEWSDPHQGYFLEFTVTLPNWGVELTGIPVCSDEDVVGLMVSAKKKWVFVPIKPYSRTVETESGSMYVLFDDGTGFCHSQKEGPVDAAQAIFFGDYDEGRKVCMQGGAVSVTTEPALGLSPLYIRGPVSRDVLGRVVLENKSFRYGKKVSRIF